MSTYPLCIRGNDDQLYYEASDGQWYLYSTLFSAQASQTAPRQYYQAPSAAQGSSYEPPFQEDHAEAGSFHGDSNEAYTEDGHPEKPSSKVNRASGTTKYVEKQSKDGRHHKELRDDVNGSARRRHKKSTQKKIDKTLAPLYK